MPLPDAITGPEQTLEWMFKRIFIEDIRKDQTGDYNADVVRGIMTDVNPPPEGQDFFSRFWQKEGVVNHILEITPTRFVVGGGGLPAAVRVANNALAANARYPIVVEGEVPVGNGGRPPLPRALNYVFLQNIRVGDEGQITVRQTGITYDYKGFPPYNTVADLTNIQNFITRFFVRIVDTTVHGNKFIANYPTTAAPVLPQQRNGVLVASFPGQTNCITPLTFSCSSDACGKINFVSGPTGLNQAEQHSFRTNYAIEEPPERDRTTSINYPAYSTPASQSPGTGLHDLFSSRDVVLRCYGLEKNKTHSVKLFYTVNHHNNTTGRNETKLVQVEENANTAGAFRKLFKPLIKGRNRIASNNGMLEMIFLSKHHGDVGQVLEKFRDFPVVFPGQYPIVNRYIEGNLSRAFESYDVLPSMKFLLESGDILLFHPFPANIANNNNDDDDHGICELIGDAPASLDRERPVIVIRKQQIADPRAAYIKVYQELVTQFNSIQADIIVYNAQRDLFNRKKAWLLAEMNREDNDDTQNFHEAVAAVNQQSSDGYVNRIYSRKLEYYAKLGVAADIFDVDDINNIAVFPPPEYVVLPNVDAAAAAAAAHPGGAAVYYNLQIQTIMNNKRLLNNYRDTYLKTPPCFLRSEIVKRIDPLVDGEGNDVFNFTLDFINIEREIRFDDINIKSGQNYLNISKCWLRKIFDSVNITFRSILSLRQKNLRSKTDSAVGLSILMFIKNKISKFRDQYLILLRNLIRFTRRRGPNTNEVTNFNDAVISLGEYHLQNINFINFIPAAQGGYLIQKSPFGNNKQKMNKNKTRSLNNRNKRNFTRNRKNFKIFPILVEITIPGMKDTIFFDIDRFLYFSKSLLYEIKDSLHFFYDIVKLGPYKKEKDPLIDKLTQDYLKRNSPKKINDKGNQIGGVLLGSAQRGRRILRQIIRDLASAGSTGTKDDVINYVNALAGNDPIRVLINTVGLDDEDYDIIQQTIYYRRPQNFGLDNNEEILERQKDIFFKNENNCTFDPYLFADKLIDEIDENLRRIRNFLAQMPPVYNYVQRGDRRQRVETAYNENQRGILLNFQARIEIIDSIKGTLIDDIYRSIGMALDN